MEKWAISCDYGTANPASFGLWGKKEGTWYRVKEYYFDSRREGYQKTDGEYAADLAKLTMPVLVIAGTKDMIWDDHTRAIAAALPDGTLAILPGDHFVAAKNPEAFNRTVLDFLQG